MRSLALQNCTDALQSEVCSLGAIPALVKLLREGGSRGQMAAAWALQVLAAATETSRYLASPADLVGRGDVLLSGKGLPLAFAKAAAGQGTHI